MLILSSQNNHGSVIKCSPDESDPDDNQYQMEMNVNGKTWLDLSIVNGEPFTDYERAVYFSNEGSDCPELECAPGDHSVSITRVQEVFLFGCFLGPIASLV